MRRVIRDKPIDVCFVLDATQSIQSVFTSMIDYVSDFAFDLKKKSRRGDFQYGAVIYRDPIDYREPPTSIPIPNDIQDKLNEFEAKQNQERIDRLKANNLYDEELEAEKEQITKKKDREKYPVNANVAIPFNNNIENVIIELQKVECDGGNDDPEDWVGALELALYELNWREKSKRYIVWIADANAHGKKYCGYDNHNEEEHKLQPLVEKMAEEKIAFVGTNILKGEDKGCLLTLQKMKEIYENHDGLIFVIDENSHFNDDEFFESDEWTPELLDYFMQKNKDPLDLLFDKLGF